MSKKDFDPTNIKSLAALREELDPQGEAVEKDVILGMPLIIKKIKPWKSKQGKDCVRVIATLKETGELFHFNGGEPMYKGVAEYIDKVPFEASVAKIGEGDGAFYLLE